jgi:hypothetical protein
MTSILEYLFQKNVVIKLKIVAVWRKSKNVD